MPQWIESEPKIKMHPELELVLCSARPETAENEERMKALLDAGLNWSEILACAIQHRLVSLLYDRFRLLDEGWLAEDQRETLAQIARGEARRSLVFLGEMLHLHGLFEAAGIPAVPFKGPALGWLAYSNFARRACLDLDFIVPQRYVPKATSLIQAHGYMPQFNLAEARGENGFVPGEYAFAPADKQRWLELHTERTLRYFPRPLDLDHMNSRAFRLEIGGQKIRTFSVEDLLVMLSVHGAKHFWERLAWVVDIALLIAAREVDWPLLSEVAKRMQSTRMLLLGLYLAREMAGASLPPTILERASRDSQVHWLATKVMEQYAGISDPSVGIWSRATFRLRSSDGFWQGFRQLSRLSMSQTETDRELIELPHFLSPLYAIVRPWRLVRKYGWGFRRRLKPDLAPYVPTPEEIVSQMLRLADITPGDVLYDLGSGDGRIVVAAAEKYGIRAVGVEIDPGRFARAQAHARSRGVADRAQFVLGDAKKINLREATVITMYLGADGNLRLADQLRGQLRPGARIVSRDFQIYGWNPDHSQTYTLPGEAPTTLYRWTITEAQPESPRTTSAALRMPQALSADFPSK